MLKSIDMKKNEYKRKLAKKEYEKRYEKGKRKSIV